ncbi:MAG: sensor histidine kinase, partial [Burkholderiales bacterium PBB5]
MTDAWLATEADPAHSPDWSQARRVSLPSDWAGIGASQPAVRWYRLSLTPHALASGPAALYGLYVERACSVLQVRLNGQLIHDGGRFEEPVSRNCHRPQLVAIPAALLRPEGNELDLRVHGYPLSQVSSRQRAGGLSAVEFGPYAVMAGHPARRTAFAIRLPEVMSGTLALMGSFMFVMGWFNRKQSYLAYFGALMVGWALLLSRLWASELPMPNAVAEALLAALMAFITLAAVQFLMRYAGQRQRWLNLALPAQCLLMPFTLWLAGGQRLYTSSGVWYALLTVQVVAAVAFYLMEARRQRSR